jgi:hypothetical protein
MSVQLSEEARGRLDGHLDAVEGVLARAGHTREQRRGVVDDLEAQILEMLGERSASPGLADVEAVLGKLDPPGAYASAEHGAFRPPVTVPPPPVVPVPPVRPRYSRTAIWGVVCILAGLLPAVLIVPFGLYLFAAAPRAVHSGGMSGRPQTVAPEIIRAVPRTAGTAPAVELVGPGPEASGPGVGQELPTFAVTTQATHTMMARRSWAATLLSPLVCVFVLVGPLGLLGTILGWVAFAQIRRSNGMVVGMGMALFDGLFYPVVTFLLMVAGLICA